MRAEQVADQRQVGGVIGLVLAEPGAGRSASRTNISGYLDYLRRAGLEYAAFQVCESDRTVLGAVLALRLPGRTTVLMLPPVGELGTTLAGQATVTSFATATELARKPHYLQALVEPDCAAKRNVLLAAGFGELTRLQYLEMLTPAVAPNARDAAWRPYGPTTGAEFELTVSRTYEGSMDCPELRELRPERDALASHRASGEFEPGLWELCELGGAVAGCLLCAPLSRADALEIVYMGVVPEQRGRGVARILLERAAQHATQRQLGRMLLVVDARNEPARRVYSRYGFRCVSVRDAFLCVPARVD